MYIQYSMYKIKYDLLYSLEDEGVKVDPDRVHGCTQQHGQKGVLDEDHMSLKDLKSCF